MMRDPEPMWLRVAAIAVWLLVLLGFARVGWAGDSRCDSPASGVTCVCAEPLQAASVSTNPSDTSSNQCNGGAAWTQTNGLSVVSTPSWFPSGATWTRAWRIGTGENNTHLQVPVSSLPSSGAVGHTHYTAFSADAIDPSTCTSAQLCRWKNNEWRPVGDGGQMQGEFWHSLTTGYHTFWSTPANDHNFTLTSGSQILWTDCQLPTRYCRFEKVIQGNFSTGNTVKGRERITSYVAGTTTIAKQSVYTGNNVNFGGAISLNTVTQNWCINGYRQGLVATVGSRDVVGCFVGTSTDTAWWPGGADEMEGGAVPTVPSIVRSVATLAPSVEAGLDAADQTFTVSNGGTGTLSYGITDSEAWMSVSPTSGTSTGEADTITVSYNTDALVAGSYSGTITITDAAASNNPQTITVSLTVSPTPAPPTIVFAPDSYTPSIDTGEELFGTNETTTLTVTNGPAPYTITSNFAIVIPSPSSGNATDTIDLLYLPTSFRGPGTYTATITATCPTCSPTTDTVTVELTIADPTPVCGDSVIEAPEACDDGDATGGDGCSATCTIEAGYTCTGEPSVCTTSTVAFDVAETTRTITQNATTTNATLNIDVTGSAAWTLSTDAPGTPPLYSLSAASGAGDTAVTLTFDHEDKYPPGTYTSTVTATCATCTPTTATHAVSLTVGALPDPTPDAAAIATWPGAVGCGSRSYGGRGPGGITPTVYWVTTLDDKCGGSACTGSLRACVEASGPRYCLFNVSGTIELEAALIVTNPYLTVAGQTANGGIQIANDATPAGVGGVIIRTHDTAWSYIRFRPGAGCDEYPYPDPIGTCDNAQDGIQIAGPTATDPSVVYRHLFDHVSVSWAGDENVSMVGARYATVQNSILSHPLVYAPFSEGNGYQAFLYSGASCFSLVKNYMMGGVDRWPHHNGTGLAEVVNNVMLFGSGSAAGRVIDNYMARPTANVIGNLWKRGTSATTAYGFDANVNDLASNLTGSVYLSGNTATSPMTGAINPADVTAGYTTGSANSSPYSTPSVSASGLDTTILPTVGASRALSPTTFSLVTLRDSYDERIVDQWTDGGDQVIEHESQELGRPYMVPHITWTDTDGDGMPNEYESQLGLNASSAADAFTDADSDGYKNLEEFLDPTRVCGDGVLQGSEVCDDGNVEDDDACAASCLVATPAAPTISGGGNGSTPPEKLLPRAF